MIAQIQLELIPSSRVDVIDVRKQVAAEAGDRLSRFPRNLFYSFHTTAGYFDEDFSARFGHDPERLKLYLTSYEAIFPPRAPYQHDKLELREELAVGQRESEPQNADSHLTFMSSGLTNCVTYSPRAPAFFVDLDGVNRGIRRQRKTIALGFSRETLLEKIIFPVPVSGHPIESVNLADPRLGLLPVLEAMVKRRGVVFGRFQISLVPSEANAGLTVNEFETLLMKHDLADVLRDPVRFMAERWRHMVRDPASVPRKAKSYAKYDLVQVVNELMNAFGLRGTLLEKVVDKFLTIPARRFLKMRRSLTLLVADERENAPNRIVRGTYQSPILVHWKRPKSSHRLIEVKFFGFE